MRFAYADPPYPGKAKKWYSSHPDYAGEVDHAELIDRLMQNYPDGWALSTSAQALRSVLILCPDDVRIAVWHVTNSETPGAKRGWHLSWEPVIIHGGRALSGAGRVRNVLSCGALNGGCSGHEDHILPGQKPVAFCQWLFALLGALPGEDDLDDLFPGSGVVGRTWANYRVQPAMRARFVKSRVPRDLSRQGVEPLC